MTSKFEKGAIEKMVEDVDAFMSDLVNNYEGDVYCEHFLTELTSKILHASPYYKIVNTLCDKLGCKPDELEEKIDSSSRDVTFRGLYEKLANEYCAENHQLYNAIAPLLGLRPFYGSSNKEQVIWASSQEEASNLLPGENIYKYIKRAVARKPYKKRYMPEVDNNQ